MAETLQGYPEGTKFFDGFITTGTDDAWKYVSLNPQSVIGKATTTKAYQAPDPKALAKVRVFKELRAGQRCDGEGQASDGNKPPAITALIGSAEAYRRLEELIPPMESLTGSGGGGGNPDNSGGNTDENGFTVNGGMFGPTPPPEPTDPNQPFNWSTIL